jgi:choline dehydrogenase-like flavoprotein
MFLNANDLPEHEPLTCDVCVVGAGPAGISVALELAGSGARVCVLEAGADRYDASAQAHYGGEVEGDSYPLLRDTRFSAFGGSTQLWAGWCRPLDPIDFEVRSWVPESGWPFEGSELLPHLARAHELCGLAESEYDPAYWQQRLPHGPLPVSDPDLTTRMFHVSPLRFGTAYRARLTSLSDVEVVLKAPVLRFHLADTSQRVSAVTLAAPDGRLRRVEAGRFVLATGGVENARLLLLSGDTPERSLGNEHGLVGRYFTEHAFVNPGTFIPSDPEQAMGFYFPTPVPGGMPGAAVRGTFTLRREVLERERLLNAALFFRPSYEASAAFSTAEVRELLEIWEKIRGRGVPGGSFRKAMRAARAPGALATAVWRKIRPTTSEDAKWPLRSFFESAPLRDNVIRLARERDSLGRPRVHVTWRIGEEDLRGVRHTFHVLDRGLRTAGLGHLELAFPDDPDSWRAACEGGKHHMGTTRMHASPAHGVVDGDGLVHGVDNLWIAGSSVFPTVGYANPTLTIVALSVRLGRHLRREVMADGGR